MKWLTGFFLVSLVLSCGARADWTTFGPDSSGFNPAGIDFNISGFPGGATEELMSYLANSGAVPKTNRNSVSYSNGPISGYKITVPTVTYSLTVMMSVNDMKSFQLTSNMGTLNGGSPVSTRPYETFTMPDSISKILYDLMSESGLKPRAGDASKFLAGKYIRCWAYHGSPEGQTALSPTCEVSNTMPGSEPMP